MFSLVFMLKYSKAVLHTSDTHSLSPNSDNQRDICDELNGI